MTSWPARGRLPSRSSSAVSGTGEGTPVVEVEELDDEAAVRSRDAARLRKGSRELALGDRHREIGGLDDLGLVGRRLRRDVASVDIGNATRERCGRGRHRRRGLALRAVVDGDVGAVRDGRGRSAREQSPAGLSETVDVSFPAVEESNVPVEATTAPPTTRAAKPANTRVRGRGVVRVTLVIWSPWVSGVPNTCGTCLEGPLVPLRSRDRGQMSRQTGREVRPAWGRSAARWQRPRSRRPALRRPWG